jgi:hypothetical protein
MSGPVQIGVRSTGIRQHVPGDRVRAAEERLSLAMAHTEQTGAHLWMVIVGHVMSPMLAARLADGSTEEPSLDVESVATVTLGCFRCERELTSARVRQPCPGEPS